MFSGIGNHHHLASNGTFNGIPSNYMVQSLNSSLDREKIAIKMCFLNSLPFYSSPFCIFLFSTASSAVQLKNLSKFVLLPLISTFHPPMNRHAESSVCWREVSFKMQNLESWIEKLYQNSSQPTISNSSSSLGPAPTATNGSNMALPKAIKLCHTSKNYISSQWQITFLIPRVDKLFGVIFFIQSWICMLNNIKSIRLKMVPQI